MGEPEHLYHYTNSAGAQAIIESGYIRASASSRGDAFYGDGVYLTALPPSSSGHEIILNNWDGRDQTILRSRRIMQRIEIAFEIPVVDIPEVEKQFDRDGRDIWLYRKDRLVLAGKSIAIYARS